MPASFYEPDGDRFVSTELTRGPWDPDFQHAGPPAALLGREVERLEEAEEFQVARISFEIMRAVPIVPLRVEMRVTRPGRRVQLVENRVYRRIERVLAVQYGNLHLSSAVSVPSIAFVCL